MNNSKLLIDHNIMSFWGVLFGKTPRYNRKDVDNVIMTLMGLRPVHTSPNQLTRLAISIALKEKYVLKDRQVFDLENEKQFEIMIIFLLDDNQINLNRLAAASVAAANVCAQNILMRHNCLKLITKYFKSLLED